MIKKAIVFIILQVLLLTSVVQVSAKTSGVTSSFGEVNESFRIEGNTASVSFADLGFRETELISPFAATRLLFSTPPNWKLIQGGDVQIDYDVLLTGPGLAQITNLGISYGGILRVSFNNQIIGTLPLSTIGSNTARLQLPPEALLPAIDDGRHILRISLDAQFSCQYDIRAVVTIKNTSMLNLVYDTSSPKLDLSRLPAPFYSSNALLPESNIVITPDEPTPGELQAALNVMAGFGSMIGGSSDFELINISKLSNDNLTSSNLIFVGMTDKLGLLSNINFPLAVVGGKLTNLPPDSAGDGVVQMAISPWSASKVALLVTGKDDIAVAKAAQAVSSGRIFVYKDTALAYVKDVQLLADSIPIVENFTFQNIGYQTKEINGVGTNSVDYAFLVGKQQLATQEGYVDLLYYHSGLLDNTGLSSLNIELNNQIINSVALDKVSEQLTTLRIKLPPGLMHYGENHLKVSAGLFADTSCDSTGFSAPWVVISDRSNFYLPVATSVRLPRLSLLDLKNYPAPFLSQSDLGDVAFVLPRSNPSSWSIAGKMAYDLGRTANPVISGLEAVYADDVSSEVRQNNSLIIIGRASAMPLLNEINDRLPAPFDFTNDTASERQLQVAYRIPQGVSVGYLELLNSPFNIEKAVFVMSGNDDNGLVLAGNAMLISELRSQVSGLFAITNGSQVAVGSNDSLFSIVGNVVPSAELVVTTPISPGTVASAEYERPIWLLPLLGVSSLTILILIGYVVRMALIRGNSNSADLVLNEEGGGDLSKDDAEK